MGQGLASRKGMAAASAAYGDPYRPASTRLAQNLDLHPHSLYRESIAGANRDARGRAEGTEIGYTLVNSRTVRDEGAMLGYCT
jgi:hypothetical protein